MPVLVGSAVAARAGGFRADALALALAGAVSLQIGANLANDYFDHRSGADAPGRRGPRRLSASGLARPRDVATAAALAFALAALAGAGLVAIRGWPIVAIGLVSIAGAVGYTGGPWPYGYRGLGDLGVFAFLGPLAVGGTAYAHTGWVPGAALAAALPVGCVVTAILVVNNVRDIETDRAAGKRTLAVLLGPRAARAEYLALLATAYAAVPALVLFGVAPPAALAALLTAPAAIGLARAVRADAPPAALNAALRATARLHLLFGAALAAGIAFG